MARQTVSSVVGLLDQVWSNTNAAVPHSWERLNHAMRNALTLAVGAGFEFQLNDMRYIVEHYRSEYWIGASFEWIYSQAVRVGNLSAAKSYEEYKGRKGFIADDVDPGNDCPGYLHRTGQRKRERLAVGCQFPWKGYTVEVTSFAENGDLLIACAYTGYPLKLLRRFRITRADIMVDRAQRKER